MSSVYLEILSPKSDRNCHYYDSFVSGGPLKCPGFLSFLLQKLNDGLHRIQTQARVEMYLVINSLTTKRFFEDEGNPWGCMLGLVIRCDGINCG